uniref:SSD domain-containing protein n=1 Tax=Haemonchus contortus TaxID=6289 RepID=A0A7I5E9U0_HAECO
MKAKDVGEKKPLLPPKQKEGPARANPGQSVRDLERRKQATPARHTLWKRVKSLFSLRKHFNRYGRCVGKHPRWFLLLSMLLSLSSYGMYKLELRDDVSGGYTAYDARSRYEAQVAREFYGAIDDPMMTSVLILAKDGGTMHRKEYLDEAYYIVKSIQNITMKYGERRLIYDKMCEPHCFGDEVFSIFKRRFDNAYEAANLTGIRTRFLNLSYPIGYLLGIPVPFEQCLFGVRLSNSSFEKDDFFLGFAFLKENQSIETQITNMEHVTMIVVSLYGNKDTKKKADDFLLWELAAYEYSHQYNEGLYTDGSLVEFLVFGTEILNMEINKANTKLSPYFGGGFGFMISFVAFCVFSSAFYYHAVDKGKIFVGIGATLCPLLAITCTYGIVTMSGSRVNSLLFVMPFLIFGVGVDAAFLMVYSWQKQIRHNYTVPERLSVVYEECGPSIGIASVTNVLSFGIGALTPTPEIRIFCLGTALSMGLTFVFQVILFGPILAIATSYEKPYDMRYSENSGWRKKLNTVLETVVRIHCKILSKRIPAGLIFVVLFIYWYFAITGVIKMKSRLDAAKILPLDSPLHRAYSLLEKYVWDQHFTPKFFVNTYFDLSDVHMTNQFWDMLKELESIDNCRGPASSYVWLRDFAYQGNNTKNVYPYEAEFDPQKLLEFLKKSRYHYDMSVKWANISGDILVKSFQFFVVYSKVTDWDIRISLLTTWRNIVDRYPDLNVTVYEKGAMFVDQMLSLRRVTIQTALLTLLSMTIVCSIFMPNVCSVVTASISIASISTGVIGFMSQMSFDLDPILMACLLMTIGMSVDYIAHIAYHFQVDTRSQIEKGRIVEVRLEGPHQRLEHTIRTVGWPMIQAGLSTVCCVFPLTFVQTYSASVFTTSLALVVLFGIVHGLIILPTFLIHLPEKLTRSCCCRMGRSQSNTPQTDKSERELQVDATQGQD